jgi:hypothetical protein
MPEPSKTSIREFVLSIMPPESTEDELRETQKRWDDYLDVVDEIHARMKRERPLRDSPDESDIVERPNKV